MGKYGPFLCRLLWSDHEGPFQTGVLNAGEAHRGGDPAKEGSLTVAASTRAQHGSSKDGAPNGGEKGW